MESPKAAPQGSGAPGAPLLTPAAHSHLCPPSLSVSAPLADFQDHPPEVFPLPLPPTTALFSRWGGPALLLSLPWEGQSSLCFPPSTTSKTPRGFLGERGVVVGGFLLFSSSSSSSSLLSILLLPCCLCVCPASLLPCPLSLSLAGRRYLTLWFFADGRSLHIPDRRLLFAGSPQETAFHREPAPRCKKCF